MSNKNPDKNPENNLKESPDELQDGKVDLVELFTLPNVSRAVAKEAIELIQADTKLFKRILALNEEGVEDYGYEIYGALLAINDTLVGSKAFPLDTSLYRYKMPTRIVDEIKKKIKRAEKTVPEEKKLASSKVERNSRPKGKNVRDLMLGKVDYEDGELESEAGGLDEDDEPGEEEALPQEEEIDDILNN